MKFLLFFLAAVALAAEGELSAKKCRQLKKGSFASLFFGFIPAIMLNVGYKERCGDREVIVEPREPTGLAARWWHNTTATPSATGLVGISTVTLPSVVTVESTTPSTLCKKAKCTASTYQPSNCSTTCHSGTVSEAPSTSKYACSQSACHPKSESGSSSTLDYACSKTACHPKSKSGSSSTTTYACNGGCLASTTTSSSITTGLSTAATSISTMISESASASTEITTMPTVTSTSVVTTRTTTATYSGSSTTGDCCNACSYSTSGQDEHTTGSTFVSHCSPCSECSSPASSSATSNSGYTTESSSSFPSTPVACVPSQVGCPQAPSSASAYSSVQTSSINGCQSGKSSCNLTTPTPCSSACETTSSLSTSTFVSIQSTTTSTVIGTAEKPSTTTGVAVGAASGNEASYFAIMAAIAMFLW